MCINGEMRNIGINDYIPCITGSNRIAFVRCLENEMWTMLLEKAWAKANHCYAKTIAGHTSEALKALTGAPTFQYQHYQLDVEEFWNIIKDAD